MTLNVFVDLYHRLLIANRLDFQPFCEPAFLAPHYGWIVGWITGLPIVFLDQSSCCVDESDLLVVLWLPLCSTRLSRTE